MHTNTIISTEFSIEYLLNNSIENEKITNWEDRVFFSGGTLIRNNLTWK